MIGLNEKQLYKQTNQTTPVQKPGCCVDFLIPLEVTLVMAQDYKHVWNWLSHSSRVLAAFLVSQGEPKTESEGLIQQVLSSKPVGDQDMSILTWSFCLLLSPLMAKITKTVTY